MSRRGLEANAICARLADFNVTGRALCARNLVSDLQIRAAHRSSMLFHLSKPISTRNLAPALGGAVGSACCQTQDHVRLPKRTWSPWFLVGIVAVPETISKECSCACRVTSHPVLKTSLRTTTIFKEGRTLSNRLTYLFNRSITNRQQIALPFRMCGSSIRMYETR